MTLASDLISTVVDAARFSPRSQQSSIGPSEIGTGCARRVAYKLLSSPATWRDSDPWAAIVGTAVHSWLATTFMMANNVMEAPRWLVEQRVYPSPSTPGSCDLYDLWTDTCLDHKVVGVSTLNSAKASGPSEQYIVQANLYALGWENLGRTPKTVAIAYWPRSGFLSGLHLHTEPYRRDIAVAALTRLTDISETAKALEADTRPERMLLIPATPGKDCQFCAWKSIRSGDGGCPDAPKKQMTNIKGI